jgi:restriction system protein
MAKIDRERIGTYLKTALEVLRENGGQLASREVMRQTEQRLDLSEYEKAQFEKTGYIRWESIMHFYSIDLTKAGWLLKKKGVWYITPEGTEALKLPPKEFITAAGKKYKEWRLAHPTPADEIPEVTEEPVTRQTSAYDQAVGLAREEIRNYINSLDPYSFQDLVAALLRAMGYHTPFVAPKGPDGGVDILAYRDPFGTQVPRIKVQVKHRSQKANVQEVRQLSGLLIKDGDTGLFVSSSGFTEDAVEAIRNAPRHIEKLDLDTLIDFWEEHYDKMDEDGQALLPLRRIAFLAPNE